jgi:ArsR family transcriptional regulator
VEQTHAIEALGALAQPTRLAVFRALVRAGREGLPAGALAALTETPPSTLSAHLRVLEQADLISARRDSRHIFYSTRFETARGLIAFLMEDCCDGHPAICVDLPAGQPFEEAQS